MRIFTFIMIFGFSTALTLSQNTIDTNVLENISKGVDISKPADRALMNAISGNSLVKIATSRQHVGREEHRFSHKVEVKGITDQKSSGRCWMFTGLNILRPQLIEKHKLSSFEFSTNYLFFFDQLEKANLFLELIIVNAELAIDDKKVEWLLKDPIGDGGVWNSFANLVNKYGLVPKSVMPETYHSENTAQMNQLLKRKLREDALLLREQHASGAGVDVLRNTKTEMLTEIYRMLAFCLGEPPLTFNYAFEIGSKRTTEPEEYTPLSFFTKHFPHYKTNEYVMLMNDPSREYFKLYEIENDKNMVEGINWKYINLPADEIKKFAIASIKGGEAMYASCDVGKFRNNDDGTLDMNNYDYESLFGVSFGMDKKSRIKSFDSGSTHAMLLMAVDLDKNGNPLKWQFENSWGASHGHNGYLSLTDEWFNEYMFRVVVHRKFVDDKVLEVLEQTPVMLPIWDPMFLMDE